MVSLFTHAGGRQTVLVIDFYLYGDRASAIVARDEPAWRAWMNQRVGSDTACGS